MAVRIAIVAVFFLSGAAGLIYEVLWTRQLGLIFGITTYAVSTVLATYMGGLALGSWLAGRVADRVRNPLLLYALLEAAIGLYGLLVPSLFEALREPYIALRNSALPHSALIAARALLAAGVLLAPTVMMGATFPLLTRFWVRRSREVGSGTGLLYFVNTAGAMTGCLLAGFHLIETYGLRGTMQVAVATNFVVAVAALVAAREWGGREEPATARAAVPADEPTAASARLATLVLLCAAVSGLTSLAYEVLWARALLRYVYNSTYAFTTMLSTFLAGIAIGSAVYGLVLRRFRHQVALLALLQVGVAAGFVMSAHFFENLMDTSAAIVGSEVVTSFGGAVLVMFLRSAMVLLFPTILLGASLPMATAICARSLDRLGYTVGRVYAVNTLGAIVGSLATGFVLIPLLEMQGTLELLIAVNIVSGAVLAATQLASVPGRVVAAGAAVGAVAALVAALPDDLFRRTLPHENQSIVFYEEGATDTVAVVETWGQRVIMYDDRRGTAGTASYGWNFFLGHLPMLLHDAPRRVLHICFGVGNSLSAVTAHDELERVDNVELSPHVVDAAPYFWTNGGVIDNPKVRTIIDDGRNFLMATNEKYDVILLEPPETFTAGVINLYTREFYEDALAHLEPDGLIMQWIPTGECPVDAERMLFSAFAGVFPHVSAWRQLNSACVLLIGSRKPLTIDYQKLQERMASPRIRRDMELSQVADVDHFLSFFQFDDRAFREFVGDARPVTDDRTVLDFAMPRYLGTGFGLGSFNLMSREGERNPFHAAAERHKFYFDRRASVVPYLTNLGGQSPEEVAQRIAASQSRVIKHQWIAQADWRR